MGRMCLSSLMRWPDPYNDDADSAQEHQRERLRNARGSAMLGKFFARRSARKYAERHKRLHVETDSVLQGDGLADLAEKEWGKWAAFWGTWDSRRQLPSLILPISTSL